MWNRPLYSQCEAGIQRTILCVRRVVYTKNGRLPILAIPVAAFCEVAMLAALPRSLL